MPSPSRTRRSSKSPSPKRHVEKTSEPAAEKEEKLEDVKLKESVSAEKSETAADEKPVENSPSKMDIDSKVEVEKSLKRPREDETGLYFLDSADTFNITVDIHITVGIIVPSAPPPPPPPPGRTGGKKIGVGGAELFCPTQTEIARLPLSKTLHLSQNNVLFMCIFQGHITCLCITKSLQARVIQHVMSLCYIWYVFRNLIGRFSSGKKES